MDWRNTAALKDCQREWLWTFACDLPLLELVHLVPIAEEVLRVENSCSGIAFVDKGRPQPLAAIWRAEHCSDLSEFIRNGGRLSTFLSTYGKVGTIRRDYVFRNRELQTFTSVQCELPQRLGSY